MPAVTGDYDTGLQRNKISDVPPDGAGRYGWGE